MTTNNKMLEAIPTLKEKAGVDLLLAIYLIDAKFYFKDWTVEQMVDGGVRLNEAVTDWAKGYAGDNEFAKDVGQKLRGGKTATLRQTRALLNVLMKESREAGSVVASTAAPVEQAPPVPSIPCYDCQQKFHTYAEVKAHKASAHPYTYKCGNGCTFESTDHAAMREHRREHYKPLFENVPVSHLDLRLLIPTGRYAAPDLDGGSGDYIFLTMREVPKTHMRTKKFRHGWVQYGSEEVVKGTLEVRRWRGDTKELVGECRPGENYRGDFTREFEMIVRDPTASAKLFGKLMGCCGRCGKSLTDPESRQRGIGPECVKHFRCRGGLTDIEADETPDVLRERLLRIGHDIAVVSATPDWSGDSF